jgi:AbiV family abortive infection protein
MKKKLDQFKGRLTPSQIASGMNVANKNAKRLHDDAKLLLEAGRYPSAASLAILSIEESGKESILRGMSVAIDDKEIKDAWKEYRSHTKKNIAWMLPQLVAEGARKLEDFRPLFDKESDHPYVLEQLKQIGFYTDCLGKAHWSDPNKVIDKRIARLLVGISGIFLSKRETTQKEIELWMKHIGPVWKRNASWVNQALSNWWVEMQENGLVPEGDNEMDKFIHRGI